MTAGSKLKRARNSFLKKSCTVLRFDLDRRTATWNAKAYRASLREGVRVLVVKSGTMAKADWGKLPGLFGDSIMPGKHAKFAVVACEPRGSRWRRK